MYPYLEPWVVPGCRAIDLGSSFGKSTFLMCELGAKVCGVDVSIGALRFATEVKNTTGACAFFVCADYAQLPFRDNSFDLALFPHNVVECSPSEFVSVVRETSRVLEADGLFLVSVAHKWAAGQADEPTLKNGTITIPGEGSLSYPTYSWSTDNVIKAASGAFVILEMKEMAERAATLMVFRKSSYTE
jgi:SAM-dependent methyltransferase